MTKKDVRNKTDFEIVSSVIKYPSLRNKTFNFKIEVRLKNKELARYTIEFRNKRGGVIPDALLIKFYIYKRKH